MDRGTEFRGEFEELCVRMGCEVRRSKPYSSSTQGAVERVNRTIRDAITRTMGEYGSRRWIHELHHLVGAYNRTPHSAHKLSPLLVHRGRGTLMQLDAEVTRRLKVTADRMVRSVARENAK